MVCRWPQSLEDDWPRPHLCKLARHSLDRSGSGSCRKKRSNDERTEKDSAGFMDSIISYHWPWVMSPEKPSVYRITSYRINGPLCALKHARRYYNAHTHTRVTALCPGLPGWAGTRKINQSGFYWSKRQWVAVASAGPYASLHLAPGR